MIIHMVRRNVGGYPQGYREDVGAFSSNALAWKWIDAQELDARFYYDVHPYEVDPEATPKQQETP